MKLIFLIILFCGITTTPVYTKNNTKAKEGCASTIKSITADAVKVSNANLDMIPSGLLLQF